MGRGVRQLVRLVVTPLHGDEDAEVVLPRHHLDRGARELGRDLVEAFGVEPFLGAADVEGADGRVVRRLFRQVGDADRLCRAGHRPRDRHRRGATGIARAQPGRHRELGRLHARPAAARRAVLLPQRSGVDPRGIVFGFPIALASVTPSANDRLHLLPGPCRSAPAVLRHLRTLKNSPRQELYGLQGFPLAYFKSFVNQKRRTSSMRSTGSSAVPMATKALGESR